MRSAWLITWSWIGDHAAVPEDEMVVAIVNYRRNGQYVKDLVENIYIERTSSPTEKLAYAKDRKSNPYPARYGNIGGVPWHGRIFCGHNPYLYARLVDNLRVVTSRGKEKLSWDERSSPSPP